MVKTDLENRVVRFIGNPDERIKEDYLRILRYFTFLALFGDVSPDAEVMKTFQLILISYQLFLRKGNGMN